MQFKKFVRALRYMLFNNSNTLVVKRICGISLKTIKGTIRKKTDQDDAWFFYLSKYHEIIFDIGANVGYTALLALIQKPEKRYVLVDPNPLALADASKNLILNSLGVNASYYPAFVSNVRGEEIKFYTIGSGAAGSMFKSHARTAASINEYTTVETVTLDDIWKFYGINPDLIKIDVEGAEGLVLEGAKELALKVKPTFLVELHALKELTMEKNADSILVWCKKTHYKAWYLKDGTILKQASTIRNRGKCHLLLLQKERMFPKYLVNINQYSQLPKNI